MAWFDKEWKGYDDWLKEVKRGMPSFVDEYIQEHCSTQSPTGTEGREKKRKLPEAVMARSLGILDLDSDDAASPPPAVVTDQRQGATRRTKHRLR